MTTTLPPRTAEQALLEHGFTGERLTKLARTVARDYCRSRNARLGDRFEDLVSVLVEEGHKVALAYDPSRSKPGYTFASYLYDKLELAVEPQFFRRKREGFGDRRYGNDGRIDLAGEKIDELARACEAVEETDASYTRWERAADRLQQPMKDWPVITERRVMRYIRAAEAVGLDFDEWVARTLDIAERQVTQSLEQAA